MGTGTPFEALSPAVDVASNFYVVPASAAGSVIGAPAAPPSQKAGA